MLDAKYTQRALSFHVFIAANFLLDECQEHKTKKEYINAILTAIQFLEEVSARNTVARHTCCIIREKLSLLG